LKEKQAINPIFIWHFLLTAKNPSTVKMQNANIQGNKIKSNKASRLRGRHKIRIKTAWFSK
jgi:hypothetical protein